MLYGFRSLSTWQGKCPFGDVMTRGRPSMVSWNLYDRVNQTVLTLKGAEKRADIETLCLKESMSSTKVKIKWVDEDSQVANSLNNEPHQLQEFVRKRGRRRFLSTVSYCPLEEDSSSD